MFGGGVENACFHPKIMKEEKINIACRTELLFYSSPSSLLITDMVMLRYLCHPS
jgi:hypothetical protein